MAGAEQANARKTPASPARAKSAAGNSAIDLVIRRRFAGNSEFERVTYGIGPAIHGPQDEEVDVLFVTDKDPHAPDDVFDRVRWGGQLVLISKSRRVIEAAAETYRTWRIQAGERGAWILE